MRGPVCWAIISEDPANTLTGQHLGGGSPSVCSQAPRACPAKCYGLECWGWAMVGSNSWGDSKSVQYSQEQVSNICFNGQWGQLIVCQTHLKVCEAIPADLLRVENRFAPTWAVHFFHSFADSPAKRGVQNWTLTPDPWTFNMSPILVQTPLVSWWHRGEAFGNYFSGRDFHPAHLGTHLHKLCVQGY